MNNNIYTDEEKLNDKISEISLINLHGLALRNNNEIYLGHFNGKDKKKKFFIEIANMIQYINKDVKVFIKMKNRISYVFFKLKNRHLNGISYSKKENKEIEDEIEKIINFMEKEFEVDETIWEKIYCLNFERKRK